MLDKQSEAEFKTAKLTILAELTRLRQLCCDPGLIYEDYQGESAKLELCVSMIKNAVDGGAQASALFPVHHHAGPAGGPVKEGGDPYHMLTGSTEKEKRAQMAASFAEDEVPVFLISLKAGGTGLNLTAADIVIHFDPWWNLAVQNQATDRAHRSGQKHVVNVYKLVMKDTIEENILKLQDKKKELADQILNGESLEWKQPDQRGSDGAFKRRISRPGVRRRERLSVCTYAEFLRPDIQKSAAPGCFPPFLASNSRQIVHMQIFLTAIYKISRNRVYTRHIFLHMENERVFSRHFFGRIPLFPQKLDIERELFSICRKKGGAGDLKDRPQASPFCGTWLCQKSPACSCAELSVSGFADCPLTSRYTSPMAAWK